MMRQRALKRRRARLVRADMNEKQGNIRYFFSTAGRIAEYQ